MRAHSSYCELARIAPSVSPGLCYAPAECTAVGRVPPTNAKARRLSPGVVQTRMLHAPPNVRTSPLHPAAASLWASPLQNRKKLLEDEGGRLWRRDGGAFPGQPAIGRARRESQHAVTAIPFPSEQGRRLLRVGRLEQHVVQRGTSGHHWVHVLLLRHHAVQHHGPGRTDAADARSSGARDAQIGEAAAAAVVVMGAGDGRW